MSIVERNVKFNKPRALSGWRKISLGSWRPTGDSSIRTEIEIDVEPALELLAEINRRRPAGWRRISFLHFFSRVLGLAIAKNPQINSVVRWGKVYPRKNVDLFFHVVDDFDRADDLGGVVVREIDTKDLDQIATEFSSAVEELRAKNNDGFDTIKQVFSAIPGFLSRPLLDLFGFALYSLNIWSPLFGSPRDTFGSVMLSNIGSFGGDNAYAPIAPYTRIPMVVALGVIKKRPFVINDRVLPRKTVRVGFVIDHRICDGVHAQRLFDEIQRLMVIEPNRVARCSTDHIVSGSGKKDDLLLVANE